MNTKFPFLIILASTLLLFALPDLSWAQHIHFEDVSEQAGVYTAGGSHGIAVHDYDGDGWDDFFIAASEGRSVLFRNNGDGTFSDVTTPAGVSVTGAAVNPVWGDVNNDGFADLFVGARGTNAASRLFLNEGNGRFIDASQTSGINRSLSVGSAVFGDYNADGWLDLFIATRDASDVLYKNTGRVDTLFINDTGISGVSGAAGTIAMQATWNDFDDDGDLDLFAVHDGNWKSRFYRQATGFPRFTDITETAGIAVARSAMGVAWGDYNNDGWPDVYVTNIDKGNLFKNRGDGAFDDVTEQTGAGLNGMSWGVVFADFDNDGDEDLFIGNTFDYDGRRSFLYENRGGNFVNIAEQAGAALSTNTFGVATGDFNRDGLMDLIVADQGGKNRLLINRTELAGNWLTLQLASSTSNAMAIGASIRIVADGKQMYRTISGGGSFCSQGSATVHIGVGEAIAVDSLIINWGPASEQVVTAVKTNTRYTLEEGASINVGTEHGAAVEQEAFLEQNYPNPFIKNTTIAFNLAETQSVEITLHDLLGHKVKTLSGGVFSAGRHTLLVHLKDLPSGVYFYKMTTLSGQQVKTLFLL